MNPFLINTVSRAAWATEISLENLTDTGWGVKESSLLRRFALESSCRLWRLPVILWEWYYPGFHCVTAGYLLSVSNSLTAKQELTTRLFVSVVKAITS